MEQSKEEPRGGRRGTSIRSIRSMLSLWKIGEGGGVRGLGGLGIGIGIGGAIMRRAWWCAGRTRVGGFGVGGGDEGEEGEASD